MEQKFKVLRTNLNELGYCEHLSTDSVLLVERLLGDLVKTTESLFHYKNVAQAAIEEKDHLKLGAEPYKCDNAKLIKECNDLHLAFIEFREKSDKSQRELKLQIKRLEKENEELCKHAEELRKSPSKTSSKFSAKSSKSKNIKSEENLIQSSEDTMNLQGKQKEIKNLKQELQKKCELCDHLKNKLENREKEVYRLYDLLEEGRPIAALNKDCCYKDINAKLAHITEENTKLKRDKQDLEIKLADAISKQHEAMQRALQLADKNKELERELRDIDQMALAVEAECNSTLKENMYKLNKYQEKLNSANMQLQNFEREIFELKRSKKSTDFDYFTLKEERDKLHNILETALDDKKRMTDRINQFTRIEHDLNIEIDRLVQTCTLQKRKIAELELQKVSEKFDENPENSGSKIIRKVVDVNEDDQRTNNLIEQLKLEKKELQDEIKHLKEKLALSCNKNSLEKIKIEKERFEKENIRLQQELEKSSRRSLTSKSAERIKDQSSLLDKIKAVKDKLEEENKRLQEEVDKLSRSIQNSNKYQDENKRLQKELEKLSKVQVDKNQLEEENRRLQQEVDKLAVNLRKSSTSAVSSGRNSPNPNMLDSVKRELAKKEEEIIKLQQEIQNLTRDKHKLISQMESDNEIKVWENNVGSSLSIKAALSKAEKERELARGDVKRLEDERESLRRRLKEITETHLIEHDRMQKLITESEEKLRKLEVDRREMMTVQGSRRATINNLEEEIESLSTQLRTNKAELEHIHTLYSQVKMLQEQTDKALADTQGQLTQVEMEYAHAQERIRELEKDRSTLDNQLAKIKTESINLKGTVTAIDAERDRLLIELDNKTERIASLEQELSSKENKIITLETKVTELKQQLSLINDEITSKDYLLKNTSSDITSMKKELDELIRAKSTATTENRRLQDELARSRNEYYSLTSELSAAKREIEDLKTQLQQYVFEIKRAEDLITQKEHERAEMLDHFRSLSQEATMLETNNNSLSNQALETKSQLTAAEERIAQFRNKIENLEITNRSYEEQIAKFSSQIANLETQLRQHSSVYNKSENELQSVKDLCCKLDDQKDALMQELREKDNLRSCLEREKECLKCDIKMLKESLVKETANVESLEKLLASSRQETVEQRIINQELQAEVNRLKEMITELQNKLKNIGSSSFEKTIDIKFHKESRNPNDPIENLNSVPSTYRSHTHINPIENNQTKEKDIQINLLTNRNEESNKNKISPSSEESEIQNKSEPDKEPIKRGNPKIIITPPDLREKEETHKINEVSSHRSSTNKIDEEIFNLNIGITTRKFTPNSTKSKIITTSRNFEDIKTKKHKKTKKHISSNPEEQNIIANKYYNAFANEVNKNKIISSHEDKTTAIDSNISCSCKPNEETCKQSSDESRRIVKEDAVIFPKNKINFIKKNYGNLNSDQISSNPDSENRIIKKKIGAVETIIHGKMSNNEETTRNGVSTNSKNVDDKSNRFMKKYYALLGKGEAGSNEMIKTSGDNKIVKTKYKTLENEIRKTNYKTVSSPKQTAHLTNSNNIIKNGFYERKESFEEIETSSVEENLIFLDNEQIPSTNCKNLTICTSENNITISEYNLNEKSDKKCQSKLSPKMMKKGHRQFFCLCKGNDSRKSSSAKEVPGTSTSNNKNYKSLTIVRRSPRNKH